MRTTLHRTARHPARASVGRASASQRMVSVLHSSALQSSAQQRLSLVLLAFVFFTAALPAAGYPASYPASYPALAALYANEIPVHVDTLWMRRPADYGPLVVGFESVAFGGVPTVLAAVVLENLNPPSEHVQVHMIYVLDPLTGDTLATRPAHYGPSDVHVAFARNANVFVTSFVGVTRVWSWPELEVLLEITDPNQNPNNPGALITSDGKRVFYGPTSTMFDVQTGDTLWSLNHQPLGTRQPCGIIRPKMSADDRFIIWSPCAYIPGEQYDPRGCGILDAATGEVLPGFWNDEVETQGIGISEDGTYVAMTTSQRGQTPGHITIYERESRRTVMRREILWPRDSVGGAEFAFTPGSTGVFVNDVTHGGIGVDVLTSCSYYPAWDTVPTRRFKYWGSSYSSDWSLNVGVNGLLLAVSRVDLGAMSVGASYGSPDNPTPEAWVYPNPSDGHLSVRLPEQSGEMSDVQYRITNMSGTEVASGTAIMSGAVSGAVSASGTGSTCQIHTDLPTGIYVLQLWQLSKPQRVLSSSYIMIR